MLRAEVIFFQISDLHLCVNDMKTADDRSIARLLICKKFEILNSKILLVCKIPCHLKKIFLVRDRLSLILNDLFGQGAILLVGFRSTV